MLLRTKTTTTQASNSFMEGAWSFWWYVLDGKLNPKQERYTASSKSQSDVTEKGNHNRDFSAKKKKIARAKYLPLRIFPYYAATRRSNGPADHTVIQSLGLWSKCLLRFKLLMMCRLASASRLKVL